MADQTQDKLRATLARALGKVETLRQQVSSLQAAKSEPIAVVGVGLRLPGGVRDMAGLWQMLVNGVDSVSEVPASRWPLDGFYDPQMGAVGRSYVREASFITDVDRFDAGFFGINPLEAQAMDPQHRLLLETAWEALESGGIVPGTLLGSSTGVFVGTTTHDYEHRMDPETASTYSMIGIHTPFTAGRIAFHLGLRGPTLAVDTACSSSLVALHLACESLRSGHSELALAAGVQLMLEPHPFILLSQARAVAPDGRSKTFSANADGYGRGEGVVVLVCERLSDALAHNRTILAVVRGSAFNHDGASNGITAPSGAAQEQVIRAALANARLEPHEVDFVECHGTGTRLGDPIEVQSLAAVYSASRTEAAPLLIGAIKPNIGHLESAAGVAGVVKVIAALQHDVIPPTVHSTPRNPFIEWDDLKIRVVDEVTSWPVDDRPSRAAVSSFGISGTNAHVILEAAPVQATPARTAEPTGPLPFSLSARTESALRDQAARLRDHIGAHARLSQLDLAFSLATTRTHFKHRATIVAEHREQLLAALDAIASGTPHPAYVDARAGAPSKLVFVFPGQGSQWPDMAKALLDQSASFRASIEDCAEALRRYTDWSLLDVLRQRPGAASLERVDVVQPVLFAMMVSLAALWRELGVVPDAVIGHSQGEIAAAHIAGALSLDDAAKIVALRSRVIAQQLGDGAMAAVSMSAAELAARLLPFGERLSLAVDNGPASVAVSGDPEAIDELVAQLEAEGIFARRIRVTYASHCAHIEALERPLLDALAELRPQTAHTPMISTADVEPIEGPELDARYWYRNLRQRVRFAEAVERLIGSESCVFVEISSHPVLSLALEGILAANKAAGAVIGTLRRDAGGLDRALLSLGELHGHGYSLDWSKYFAPHSPIAVELPTYAFEDQRHWMERLAPKPGSPGSARRVAEGGHPLLGRSFRMSTPSGTRYWEQSVSAQMPAWLGDHRVEAVCLFPGTGFAELALSAARELAGSDALVLEQLELQRALVLRSDQPSTVQVAVSDDGASSWQVAISESSGASWQQLASARVSLASGSPSEDWPTLAAARAGHTRERQPAELYAFAASNGLNYGPAFQGIESLWLGAGDSGVLARIALPTAAGEPDEYVVHPALLDACFHLTIATVLDDDIERGPAVPVLVERVRLLRPLARGPIWCAATPPRPVGDSGRTITDLTLWDADGELLGRVDGLHAEPLGRAADGDRFADAFLELAWRPLDSLPQVVDAEQRWLVFADRRGVGPGLQSLFESRGARAELITDANPLDASSVDAVFERLSKSQPIDGVVCLWSLDAPSMSELARDAALDAGRSGWTGLLHVVQSIIARQLSATRIVAVTQHAHAPQGEHLVRPEQALVWGLGGTIRSEHASLRPLLVDLDALDDREGLADLVTLALADTREDQVVLRKGSRWVARLERTAVPPSKRYRSRVAEQVAYRLEVDAPGSLDSLQLVGFDRRPPGPDEVELAVEAAGINFRDVLLATGIVPPIGDSSRVRLGFECAGTIVRRGSGVGHLEVGQRAIALTADGFATHVLADAARVFPIPDTLDFADAATLPIVHISAYYSLHHVARLRADERVLIHSATGGVGLAALQWARHVGAKIYATAGNQAKREWLREQGIEYVSDSRSSDFVGDITRWTNGEGVDVVLNSLSGDLMRKSLGLLRPGGRFVELGLRDALGNAQLGLARFARGLSYALVNVGEMALHSLPRVREVFTEVLEHVRTGVLEPLPHTDRPLSQAADVFWEMGRARHIGKFVLTTREPKPPTIAVPVSDDDILSRAGSYLISGGLGGLGLRLAQWMAKHGAGHLILLSRRGVTSAEQRDAVAAIEASGTRVTAAAVDVADLTALESVLATVPAAQPLRGIVHAAGLLDDAMLGNQSVARFERVLAPKVAGAWNLHLLSKHLELDFFVLYSSAASVFGNPGQANYVAANAFLDALARHRRGLGLPALSLSWGAFSEVGLAAAQDIRGARLSNRGVIALSPDDGVEMFSRVVTTTRAHVAPCPIDIPRWLDFSPEVASWPYFANLVAEAPAASSDSGNLLDSVRAATPDRRRELLLELVLAELARVLRVDPKSLGAETPFAEFGVDSLMGVELRNRLQAETKVNLPSTTIWTYPTPDKLAAHLAEAICPDPIEPAATAEPGPTVESAIAQLDDDDVEALLRAELELT